MTKIKAAAFHQTGEDEFHQIGDHQNGDDQQRLARIAAQIDETVGTQPMPIAIPEYGGPQRDAINSVVDNLVHDVIEQIASLKKQLDRMEQQVLNSGAAAKETLTSQIMVCSRVRGQCHQIGEMIADISQKVTTLS